MSKFEQLSTVPPPVAGSADCDPVQKIEILWDNKLNLVGHCAICLSTVTSSSSRRHVETMNHLWSYLRNNWSDEYASTLIFLVEKGRNRNGDLYESRVPPLCSLCQDSLKILDKLHQDMISIKRKIDIQAGAIRRMMESGKFEKGFMKFARDVKHAQLPLKCVTNTVEFLSRLHNRSTEELDGLLSSVSEQDKDIGESRGISQDAVKSKRSEYTDNTFYGDSDEENPHTPASTQSLFDPEGFESSTSDPEDGSSNIPQIKVEPQSDREDTVDPNLFLEIKTNISPGAGKEDDFPSTSSKSRKPCPKSVKKRKKQTSRSKGVRANKRSKVSDIHESDNETPGKSRPRRVKVKKEIQTDDEPVSNEDDDSDSDWDEDLPASRNKPSSSSKIKSETAIGKSEFKYKTHSRKKCEVCQEKLPLSILFTHLQTHVKDYACKCPNCGQSFMSKHRLEVYHYQKWPKCRMAAGLPPPPWTKKCEGCDFASDSHVTLRSHLQKHEIPTEKNFTCPFKDCEESFTLRQNVEFHLDKHYNQGSSSAATQRCPICRQCIQYNAEVDMKNHLKVSHKLKEVFACKGCPQVYHNREALVKHIFPTHQKEGIKCDICVDDDVRFFKENQLREHYFTAHMIGSRQTCNICDYVGFCSKQLQKHKWYKHKNGELSTPLKIFRCEICKDNVYEYKSKDALTSHNIRFHGATPFTCKICGENFETKNRWWRHERLHLGPIDPRYKCEYCGKQFNVANKLKDHVDRVHLKAFVNTFKCDQCDKSYSDICGLRYHKSSVHLGIKYFCEECGEKFSSPGALKAHQRRHTGERPYQCNLCGNSFRQPDAYKRHLFCHETLGEKFKPKKTNDRKFKTDTKESTS